MKERTSKIAQHFFKKNTDLLYLLFRFLDFADVQSFSLVSKLFLQAYYPFILNINSKLLFFSKVPEDESHALIKKSKDIMISVSLGDLSCLNQFLGSLTEKEKHKIRAPLSTLLLNPLYDYEISLLHSALKNPHLKNEATIERLLHFYEEQELEWVVLNMEAYAFAIEGHRYGLEQTNNLSMSYLKRPVSNKDYLTLIYALAKKDYDYLQKGIECPLIYPRCYKNIGLDKEYSLTNFQLSSVPLLQIIQQGNIELLTFFCQQFREQPFADSKQLLRQTLDQPRNLDWLNQSTDTYGRTALHYAVSLGYLEIVQLLTQWGMDLSQKDKQGNTPIDYARANKQEKIISYLESVDLSLHNRTCAQ